MAGKCQAFARLPPLPATIIDELHDQLAQEEAAFATLRTDLQPLHKAIEKIKENSAQTIDDARAILEREQEKYLDESATLRVVHAAGGRDRRPVCVFLPVADTYTRWPA